MFMYVYTARLKSRLVMSRGAGMRQSFSLSDLQKASSSAAAVQRWRRWGLGAHQMLNRQSSTPSTPSNSTHHLASRSVHPMLAGHARAVRSVQATGWEDPVRLLLGDSLRDMNF